MDILDLVRINIFSPMVLAFVLGIIAVLIKSDLKLPDQIYAFLSLYLLFAIGLKGGFELAHAPLQAFFAPAVVTVLLGCAIPVWSYFLLRRLARLDVANAAAIAAHYGSVSAITFSASITFLASVGYTAEGFMPTLVALMEIPAIVVALMIAAMRSSNTGLWQKALHEVVTGQSILLLIGGVVIGLISGDAGYRQVAPLFIDLFPGLLTLFLLEMGLIVGRSLGELRKVGGMLIAFAIVMPLLHGGLGVVLGKVAGLSLGGSVVMGVLAASASYIAAPAAVRVTLPQANPSLYLTPPIAITFPFNLTIGLPLYFALARVLFAL